MKFFFLLFNAFLLSINIYAVSSEPASTQKYALVTGATRGIGKAVIDQLLKKEPELKIFAIARSQENLTQLFNLYPCHIIPIAADLEKTGDIQHVVETVNLTLATTGILYYMIHNAAGIEPIGDTHYLSTQSISKLASLMETTYKINIIAPHLLTLALLPELKKSHSRILFVSSVAGETPVPGAITYSCTKAALDHLARNLQASLNNAVAVGVLHPGVVDTDMHAALRTYPKEHLSISEQLRKAKENNELIPPQVAAQFMVHLLYETSKEEFSSKKWNIYFTRPNNLPESLCQAIGKPPHYIQKILK